MSALLNILSAIECSNATSGGNAIRKLHDGGGLYLWVYYDGRKYWRLRYSFDDKEKSLSFGVFPQVSLKEAREVRDINRKLINDQIDPSAARKAKKLRHRIASANSFEAVANEWYGKQLHTWVPHHADDVKRRLESNSFPFIGKRPIAEIEAPELLEMVRKIEKRGAYDLAHRLLQVCSQVFRYGIATGRCQRDVAADLRGALTPHVKKHQAAVRPEELPDLLRAIDTYGRQGALQTMFALQLLAMTFVRTNELISAEWPELDLEAKLWIIPAGRMKMRTEHVVPLCNQAVTILKELKTIAGHSRFVFPGRNRDRPISNNTMLFALYRLGYKGRMTGHGFRTVASTILNEQGYRGDVIERQLAHCERDDVRGAYNRAEYLNERIKMMQEWADYLDTLKAGAKLISMRGRSG